MGQRAKIKKAKRALREQQKQAAHFAHLRRTSDDPNCTICRDAARARRG